MCKTNHQNLVQFWKSYYGPNIGQVTCQLRGAEPHLKLK